MIRLIFLLAILTPIGLVLMMVDWWFRYVGLASIDNCFTWAARNYVFKKDEHHLDIRKSHWGHFPHFSVLYELKNGDMVRKEYAPTNPNPQWFLPLFFKGEEVTTYYRKESS